MNSQYADHLDIAKTAALKAGTFIVGSRASDFQQTIEEKTPNDYVSRIDKEAEHLVRDTLSSAFPGHTILGEEFGQNTETTQDYTWVIDPLDGTTNFIRGIEHYAVSIALLHKENPVVACVYDPCKQEMFTATDGGGAFLNGERIVCSDQASLRGGLYATGIPFSGTTLANLDCFTNTMVSVLQAQTSGIRRFGAAALDLAYVAAGRYDGFWEANLRVWDIAAGALLVQESGGVVSALDGSASHLANGHILACAAGTYTDMLNICSQHYASWSAA